MIFYDGGMGVRSSMTYDDDRGGGKIQNAILQWSEGEELNMCFMFVFWLPEYIMYRTDIALGKENTNLNNKILSADEDYFASTTQTNNTKTYNFPEPLQH